MTPIGQSISDFGGGNKEKIMAIVNKEISQIKNKLVHSRLNEYNISEDISRYMSTLTYLFNYLNESDTMLGEDHEGSFTSNKEKGLNDTWTKFFYCMID